MLRRFIAAFLLILSLMAGGLSFASAASADDSISVADYTPTRGEVVTEADDNGNGTYNYAITLSFSLSPTQLDALQRIAQYLELDFPTYNGTISGDSEAYGVYGNLPRAQQDVGFHDSTFTPSITMVPTDELQADTHYWGTVKFTSGASATLVTSAQFVPSRWYDALNPKEASACAVGDVTQNFAWCVFPVDNARVWLTQGLVPVDGSHYSLDPGRLDFGEIA